MDERSASTARPPVQLTHFVGRRTELDELARLIEGVRALTLTGAGGSGKTRLASELCVRLAPGVSRIAWVDLAPLAEASVVASHIASALDAVVRPDETALARVIHTLGGDRTLLVLDNCEHLVDECARVTESLLRACPLLVVLATSREALGVTSETAWLVPPLTEEDAGQLFVERAQATLPSFTMHEGNRAAIGEICRRLDGIPLAIELAAARVRVLSPEQIARRLDDAFGLLTSGSRTALPRHRTLRATMEWSVALLGERERVLLRRLAAFAGGFTLEAAEGVCAGDALEPEDILDGVAALVDRSLVVMEPGDSEARYRLLETVRQYGVEQMVAHEELHPMEVAHARYFLAMANELGPQIVGGTAGFGAMSRLGADADNLRKAAAFTLREGAHDAQWAAEALRLADSLFWFWYGAGHWLRTQQFAEARAFTTAALALDHSGDPLLRARALIAAGLAAHPQGRFEEGLAFNTEALAIATAHDDPALAIMARGKMGAALLMLGRIDEGWACSDHAWSEVAKTPAQTLYGFVGVWRALLALERNEPEVARETLHVVLDVSRQSGNTVGAAHAQSLLGRVAVLTGNLVDAGQHLRAALAAHHELGDWWGTSLDLEWLAALASARGRHGDAVRFHGAVDALRERVGMVLYPIDKPHRDARTDRAQRRLGAQLDALYADGRSLSADALAQLAADDSVLLTAEHRVPSAEQLAAHAAAARATAAREAAAERLQVRAFGPLHVRVGGRTIEPTAWGSARPRELLLYLLLHPTGRTKEQVGLEFWPDASAAQLRNSFHVTLHRLRKALGGAQWVTLVNDRYRVEPAMIESFDVSEFEHGLAESRRAITRGADDATALMERAVALYAGDLLDGEPVGDWHLEHRDRLQVLHAEALMTLGARHEADERPARAVESYRRLLAHDPLHEDAMLALMRCLGALGERAQALRLYQRFVDRSREELEAEPQAETELLAEQLRRGTAIAG